MSDYLPRDIWAYIFHKLPIKYVGTCAFVCKAWKSLITDVEFIHEHFVRSIQGNNGVGSLLLRCSRPTMASRLHNFMEFYSLHLDNEQFDLLSTFKYPFIDWFASDSSRVVGTCNGLVCLVDDLYVYSDTFIIWNPSIQKYVKLPKPHVRYSPGEDYETWVGFGFDSRNKDFKVVRLVTPYCDRYPPEVEVYSLATGSWRTIIDAPSPFTIYSYLDGITQPQIFMNGMIHWVVSRESNGNSQNLISTFDVVEERFGELMLPRPLKESAMRVSILEGGEKLAVVRRYNSESGPEFMSIWVMEEYGVVDSWKEVFNSDSRYYGRIESLLSLRNSGKVMLEVKRGVIVSLDLGRNSVRSMVAREACYPFVGYHAESLFLLNNENVVSY